ncbi:zinc finger BED domain-containing protein RICESLEEPER 2-like [Olea europaea var. sylvestris]|uniref:zinc finger BED domain-containing protein RICESLEEPER 2-like n=1 Tax=Olea europaea var. sylvestris TaxID=158386 RepID=UPI000C1D7529|nr:zinc finger BED domain-containing protein RICESLEEPER 2-like [Olea europaea var. sylvestris]
MGRVWYLILLNRYEAGRVCEITLTDHELTQPATTAPRLTPHHLQTVIFTTSPVHPTTKTHTATSFTTPTVLPLFEVTESSSSAFAVLQDQNLKSSFLVLCSAVPHSFVSANLVASFTVTITTNSWLSKCSLATTLEISLTFSSLTLFGHKFLRLFILVIKGSESSFPTPPASIGSASASIQVGDTSTSTPITSQSPSEVNANPIYIDLGDDEEMTEENRKRKLTSSVWQHFKLQRINNVSKAICRQCNKQLGGESKNGTSHLHAHLNRCPLQGQKDVKQMFLNQFKEPGGRIAMGAFNFDQEKGRTELANMIILHEYPLSMVEHTGFRKFCNIIQPLFKVVSHNTIKADILKIYDYERTKVMGLLERTNSRIAVTTDMWTSNQKKGFMAITAHYIDDSWRLQSRILRFIYVPCPHTTESLSTVLMDCLFDWNIDQKLSTLTVDNCTTNDAMINIMLDKLSLGSLLLNGEFFHLRCCAHILNLIVKDGLDVISPSVERIRDSVSYWSATPKRVETFEAVARQMKIPCGKKLVLDCKTRWNSMYLKIHTALLYKELFPRLRQREPHYRSVPSESDWELATEICDKLEIFYEVTELFSGTKYPTANLSFSNICDIKLAIHDWSTSSCDEVKWMASSMKEKFDKYWSGMHEILAIATILNPRYKMKLVEYYFPLIFGDEAQEEVEKIRAFGHKLLKEYKRPHRSIENTSLFPSSSQSKSSTTSGKHSRMAGFDTFISLSVTADHNVARDLLAISVSTVASESAFSTSENSAPSSYSGACAKYDDEHVDEEESTLSFDGCQ